MAIGMTNASSGTTPINYFIPTKWNEEGLITAGRWQGALIPVGAFVGYTASYGAFNMLETLEHSGVTRIGAYAFQRCRKLTTADFPLVTNVGQSAFQGCGSIKTVKFPLVTSIGSQGFAHCFKCTIADFSLLKSIGRDTFWQCQGLITLILRSTTLCTLSAYDPFYDTPITKGTGYIYVPAALVNSYKIATNWVTYANQIRAIEDYPAITGG